MTGEWAAQQPVQDDEMAADGQDGQMADNETDMGHGRRARHRRRRYGHGPVGRDELPS